MTAYRERHNAGLYTLGTIQTQEQPPAAAAEPEPDEAAADPPQPSADTGRGPDLDTLTKQELLEFAKQLGVTPANNDMTKAELREGIDAHLA